MPRQGEALVQGHWSVVGQPVPFENGQHTHTHLLGPAVTVTVAVLVFVATVPFSPEPVSPSV